MPGNVYTYKLGYGLTLVWDKNADDFDHAWAIVSGSIPSSSDYDSWWDELRPSEVHIDRRALAVIIKQRLDIDVNLDAR